MRLAGRDGGLGNIFSSESEWEREEKRTAALFYVGWREGRERSIRATQQNMGWLTSDLTLLRRPRFDGPLLIITLFSPFSPFLLFPFPLPFSLGFSLVENPSCFPFPCFSLFLWHTPLDDMGNAKTGLGGFLTKSRSVGFFWVVSSSRLAMSRVYLPLCNADGGG